jgi:hypothetical protein
MPNGSLLIHRNPNTPLLKGWKKKHIFFLILYAKKL